MEIKAKLLQVLPLQSGEGKNGPWKKQDIIVETTTSQYPKKVCVSVWNDKINEAILKTGNELNISFDVESREFNGRWYTDVKAWKVELMGGNAETDTLPELLPDIDFAPETDNPDDDLPF